MKKNLRTQLTKIVYFEFQRKIYLKIFNISQSDFKYFKKLASGTCSLSHSYLGLCKVKKDVEATNFKEIVTMKKTYCKLLD